MVLLRVSYSTPVMTPCTSKVNEKRQFLSTILAFFSLARGILEWLTSDLRPIRRRAQSVSQISERHDKMLEVKSSAITRIMLTSFGAGLLVT